MPCAIETRRARVPLPTILLAVLCGCGEKEDKGERQPTVAEVRAFTAEIERTEAAHKAEAIRVSRAKEETVKKEHSARLRAEH